MQNPTNKELADSIRVRLFGSRDSVEEALAYAQELIGTLQPGDQVAAYTALQVVLNTVADKIEVASILQELGVK